MATYLVAAGSVHVVAAAADYLADRVTPEDVAIVLAVREEGADPRDAGDVHNVAEVRLGAIAAVETVTRAGDPAEAILALAGERDADVVVIGPWGGTPGGTPSLGGTARAVIERANRPVVVVPLDDLS